MPFWLFRTATDDECCSDGCSLQPNEQCSGKDDHCSTRARCNMDALSGTSAARMPPSISESFARMGGEALRHHTFATSITFSEMCAFRGEHHRMSKHPANFPKINPEPMKIDVAHWQFQPQSLRPPWHLHHCMLSLLPRPSHSWRQ